LASEYGYDKCVIPTVSDPFAPLVMKHYSKRFCFIKIEKLNLKVGQLFMTGYENERHHQPSMMLWQGALAPKPRRQV